jgi:hypothetical protein
VKGKYRDEDDFFTHQICAPFRLLIDDAKLIDILYFNIDDKSILLPSFSSKYKDWKKMGRVYEKGEDHEFTFHTISSSLRTASISVIVSYENDKWVFSAKQ